MPSSRLLTVLLGSRLPVTTGSLHAPALRAPITIRRDSHGIAYVEAEHDAAAWYGLGFCHGQDRAFQLECLLRIVRGTLSEITGPSGLAIDRLSRRIGFAHSAGQQLTALDAEAQAMLAAYARGTHDGATRGCRRAAHEFALLFARPTPYTPADALAIVKFLAFNLASNWDTELARLLVLTQDGDEAVRALDPAYPEWHPVTAPPRALAGPAARALAEDLAAFAGMLLAAAGRGGGSNNWVVAPERTATGRPILANDPHLAALLPPFWYLAHVRTPDWAIAGASFVGAPVFPAGHNGTAAWGMTAGFLDNTDLFVEELGPDGRSVREGERFVPCPVRHEVIRVRGGKPVVEDVLVTPRGPIVSPALRGAEAAGALSMRATWLDPRPARGLLCLHRVRSFEDFRRAFAQWPAIPLNLVYADTSGTIGWQLVGDAPRRRKGYGTIPLPGWDADAGWEPEPVPFEQMPHASNPACGFLATANNKPAQDDGNSPFLSVDWLDGYRIARIGEVLASRSDWDVAGMQALQMDRLSLPWREVRDVVLATPARHADARQALDLLQTWDGVVAPDSPAATVFEGFLLEMSRRTVRARAPKTADWMLGRSTIPLMAHTLLASRSAGRLVRLLRDRPDGWFQQPWPEEIADALGAVARTLRKRFGADPARWQWGSVRPLTLRHFAGDSPLVGRLFNLGPFPWGGDTDTINHASVDPFELTAGAGSIPSLRMVLDVGNWDENRFALPGGQSGNPCSPHYADLLPYWRRGDGVPVAWSTKAVRQVTQETLQLHL